MSFLLRCLFWLGLVVSQISDREGVSLASLTQPARDGLAAGAEQLKDRAVASLPRQHGGLPGARREGGRLSTGAGAPGGRTRRRRHLARRRPRAGLAPAPREEGRGMKNGAGRVGRTPVHPTRPSYSSLHVFFTRTGIHFARKRSRRSVMCFRISGRITSRGRGGAAGRGPSAWRDANAPWRNWARPSGNPRRGPTSRDSLPATCCTACADGASTT